MARRAFLSQLARLAALPFFAGAGALQAQSSHKQLKILMKSAWGSDDPTKAAFPFSHGLALAEAGREVQIYLLGEAVVLMRKVVADAVTPVGWPRRMVCKSFSFSSFDLFYSRGGRWTRICIESNSPPQTQKEKVRKRTIDLVNDLAILGSWKSTSTRPKPTCLVCSSALPWA